MDIQTNSANHTPRSPGSTCPGHGARAGFALPAAILVLAVVAILIAGGFHLANQEQQVGMSSERSTHAFYMAESALGDALANWSPAMAGSSMWEFGSPMVQTSPRGTVSVQAMRVDDRLYYLESSAQVNEGGALNQGAQRTLGLMIRQHAADFPVDAALTTQGQVRLRGSSLIDGHDRIPAGWNQCPGIGPTRPGVRLAEGGDVDVGGSANVLGDPPHLEDSEIDDDTFTQFGDLSWNELVAMATIVIPADGSSGGTHTINNTEPSLDSDGNCNVYNRDTGSGDMWNWGEPGFRDDPNHQFAPCHNHYPIIYVNGNARIQSNGVGQGILLVEGDVDLRGNFNFYGILITQGSLETQGGADPRILGGAIARNVDLERQSYVGSSQINFSSCVINEVMTHAQGLNWAFPLASRAWADVTAGSY
ncbi:MAG: hypothetical protein EA422_10745 [Gemmatimonadales bacterium]|nr:MAG: hypothetical protein EA422_10745 [Gemmatimonadales bacterium]